VQFKIPPNDEEIRARIESALYAYGRPLNAEDLAKAAGISSQQKTIKIVKQIMKNLNENMVALEIAEFQGPKFVMQLKPQYTKIARKFSLRPLMSRSVLNTLTQVAYLQPVSSTEIVTRRGSQAYNHLRELCELGFLELQKTGRKTVYRTTDSFSDYFGLSKEPSKIKKTLSLSKTNASKKD